MLNHEPLHPYFNELCALAAGGQISEPEFVELQDHLKECAECRSAYSDFTDLLHYKMPLAHPELTGVSKPGGMFSRNSSYRERFLAQARKQGLAVPSVSLRDTFGRKLAIWLLPSLDYAKLAALATVVLLVVVGILSYSLHQSNVRYRTLAADLAALSRQISQQSGSIRNAPQEIRSRELSPIDTAPTAPVAPASIRKPEPASLRQDLAAAEARVRELREQLQAADVELQGSRKQFQEASDVRNQLENKLAEAQQLTDRVNRELQSFRDSRSKDAATIATQDLQVQKLSEQLAAQKESLERETTLLAAGRDIHDLMGARNLHIVDVLDVDSKGKDKRAFGRVFYTEGKSLIFYAFDLGDRTTARRNASFQVWGARGPKQNPAQSLGIFYVDDQKQNRWVLKFDDPRTLAEIDSVFVTVEPAGGSAKPTGNKLLYAYLLANPNHP